MGSPIGFIRKHQRDPESKAFTYTVSKKLVYIDLPFEGDSINFQTNKKLRYTIEKLYNKAKLLLIEPKTPL